MKDLTVGKPMRVLIGFSLPLFLGLLFQMFYSLADVRIIGGFLHDDALADVSSTTTLSDLIVGFLVGLMNGFAVITAQSYGAGDMPKVRKTFAQAIRLGLIISVMLTAVSLAFLDGLMFLLNIPAEHIEGGKAYIGIILAGMTFSMLYNALASTLRALGDTIAPLCFLAASAVLNIGLDLLFIAVFDMGVSGAAAATVLSQALSFIACAIYIHIRYPQLHIKREDFKADKALVGNMLSTGLSMGFMSSLVCLGTVVLQSAINLFGTDIIVAHGAARKITSIFMLPFAVSGMAMATYSGQNYGAGKYSRVKEGLYALLKIGAVWSVFVALVAWTVSPLLITAITDTKNTVIIENASLYLRVDTLLYMACCAVSAFRNMLQGVGDHRTPLISSGIELVGKILAAYLLSPLLGYFGIILTEPIVWVLMVIPLIIRSIRFFGKIPKETV